MLVLNVGICSKKSWGVLSTAGDIAASDGKTRAQTEGV
jgi:hypothetical protein